jgi:glycine cleavage system H protein
MTVYYSEDHEYLKIDGDTATVGITDYAQKALGDVVFVELPKVGAKLSRGGVAGVVESVKSASEVYAPVSGEVVAVNDNLAKDSALVNADAEGAAWFFKIRLSNPDELKGLKDAAGYQAFIAGL